jgi:hypothetical protein
MTTIQLKIPILIDLIFVWPVLLFRLLKFGYTYRRIPLGENRFTLVDPRDFYWLNKYHWTIDGNGENIYATRNIMTANGKRTIMRMHREIMNAPAGTLVDHKNNKGFDNRRANLRLATHAQNMHNRGKFHLNTTSQFVGVHLDKRAYNWKVQIRHQGKTIFLGRYDSEIEAARAYDRAARKYHGEFARLNFAETLTDTD